MYVITFPHRRYAWGASNLDSFTDAARSPASTVFVQLGTNDTACMRAGNALCGYYPPTETARQNEKHRIVLETTAGARTLLDAGKCVIWAGPREIDRAGSARVDAADMNNWLRELQRQYPGRFYYCEHNSKVRPTSVGNASHLAESRSVGLFRIVLADYSAFSFDNADLRHSLDEAPGADRIHPSTPAGRQAIANFAVLLSRSYCRMP